MWENIVGVKSYSRPRGFNIVGARAPAAPAVPTPLSYSKNATQFKNSSYNCKQAKLLQMQRSLLCKMQVKGILKSVISLKCKSNTLRKYLYFLRYFSSVHNETDGNPIRKCLHPYMLACLDGSIFMENVMWRLSLSLSHFLSIRRTALFGHVAQLGESTPPRCIRLFGHTDASLDQLPDRSRRRCLPGSSPYQVVGSVTGHSYASLTLRSPRPSRCPGLTTSTGQRSCCEPSAVVRCVWPRTWNRLPTALRSPELSLSSFKRQLKTHLSVPVLDSAGCSGGCRILSSGAVVSVSLQHTREIDLWISAIRRGHRDGVMGRPSPATRLTWLWWWWWWWCNVM